MATLQHISDTGRVTTITYDEGCGDTYTAATMRLGHKTGLWELYDVAKCYNADYIDTGIRQDRHDYLAELPLAMEAMIRSFEANEPKHGKGLRRSPWNMELDKAIKHAQTAVNHPRNDSDGCYHLASALARIAMACNAYIEDHGHYEPREPIKDKIKRLQEPEQQYRPLGDSEVIQRGDEFLARDGWADCVLLVGDPRHAHPSLEFRRPLKGGEDG